MLSKIKKFFSKKERLKNKFLKYLEKLKEKEIIDPRSYLWIKRVINLKDKTLEEVMVPRVDVITIPADATFEEIVETYKKHGFSKIPVVETESNEITGILYIKELIKNLNKKHLKAKDMASPKLRYMPSNKNVLSALQDMQTERISIAIVVDEYGTVVGIVTMEDLLEEIVGEIMDELDREEPLYREIGKGVYEFAGKIDIETVENLLKIKLESKEMHTLGGLLIEKLKRMPRIGDKIKINSYEFRVKEATPQRILKIEARKVGT